MIYHPLRVLRDNGIEDITIVSSPSGVGQLAALLGSGHDHGCTFTYRVQDQPGGIAAALACAFGEPEQLAVILGDNVFLHSPNFRLKTEPDEALCFLTEINDADVIRQFGVAVFGADDHLEEIMEKPNSPPSNFAVTGLYVFPPCVQLKLHRLVVGKRGEFEITDLLNMYGMVDSLRYQKVDGFWGDAGTHEGIAECSAAIRRK